MNLQTCPHCGVQVVPTGSGVCPSCRRLFRNAAGETAVEDAASTGAAAVPVIILPDEDSPNPFAPPKSAAVSLLPRKPDRKKEPFSHQAAKFSAYAPAVLFALGMCVQGAVAEHRGTPTGMQMAWALGGLSMLTTLSAFVLGFVGLFGGIARRAGSTIVFALIGIVFNAGMIALWTSVILEIFGRR
jgi:hypothetical protein